MAAVSKRTGPRMDSAAIKKLAEEAEAGYDLSRAKRKTRGRPSLSASGVSPTVQVRLDADLAVALRKRAKKENRSLSDIAREALRSYIGAN